MCSTRNPGKVVYPEKKCASPISGLSSVCFCRMNTTDAVVKCNIQACPIFSFHLTCLKVQKLPKRWFCPLCQKTAAARNEKLKGTQTKGVLDEALKLDCICVCNKKPVPLDKLLKCQNPLCENGQFSSPGFLKLQNGAKQFPYNMGM